MIATDYDIALLAVAGIILIIRQKKLRLLFPLFWLISTLVIMFKHNPVWYHYYLLVSIPLAWLAAIGFSEFFHMDTLKKKKFLSLVIACLIILSLGRLPVKYNRMCKSIQTSTAPQEKEVLNLLSQHKKDTRWIVTDRPIFAFYAGMLAPPEMAVITSKRVLTKNLVPKYFINTMEKYKPKLLLLGKYEKYNLEIMSYVEKKYFPAYLCQPKINISSLYYMPYYWKRLVLLKRLELILQHYEFEIAQNIKLSSHPNAKIILYALKDT